MTQVADRLKPVEIVMVECLGIACPTGFNLDPVGFEPSFVNFEPGKAQPLARHYADWLVAQDANRFVIKTPEKASQPSAPSAPTAPVKAKPPKKAGAKKK